MSSLVDRIVSAFRPKRPTVPLIPLSGLIAARGGALPGGRSLSLATLEGTLERAFAMRGLVAVGLLLNSPGGSPVQSSLIAGRIRALAERKKVPVLGFVEDVAASGGYWLACAADEIHADPSSIVGSIGVISAGFGFEDAIARLGVRRRVHTAGGSKSFLDPFQPEKEDDLERLHELQEAIHGEFKTWVRTRRGSRLKLPEAKLFDGRVWTGRAAVDAGLVDGIGDARAVLRARFGEKVRLRRVATRERSLLQRVVPPGIASDVAAALLDAIEERAARARLGP